MIKWKLVGCVLLLACTILQAAPVMAEVGGTEVSGTMPLEAYDFAASNIGYHSATISWKTNGDATSQVFYDTASHDNTGDYAHCTDEDANLVSEHSLNLTGLSSRTTYHYRVKSVATVDGSVCIAFSEDYTFTTLTLTTPKKTELPLKRSYSTGIMALLLPPRGTLPNSSAATLP